MTRPSGWIILERASSLAVLAAALVVIWVALSRHDTVQNPANGPMSAPQKQAVERVDRTVSTLPVAGGHRKPGSLVLIEFSDLECPFCGRFARDVYPEIKRRLVDAGKLEYVFRHLPISSIHPNAFKAAQAVECARDQGRFEEMRLRVFASQDALTVEHLSTHAEELGLERSLFTACVTSETAPRVQQDIDEAIRLHVRSTPTFFLGVVLPNERSAAIVRRVNGVQPYAVFERVIDESRAPALSGARLDN